MNRFESASQVSPTVLAAAREAFFRDGIFEPTVPETVRESWIRCRTRGVDPRNINRQTSLDAVLNAAMRASHLLLQASESRLEILDRVWKNEPHMVVVSDPSGVLLRVLASAAERESGRQINMVEGATWDESAVGTNAVGTAIATQQPVSIVGAQHYSDVFTPWTCVGIPVHRPDGNLAGAIDLSVRSSLSNEYAWELVSSIAEAVETELRHLWPTQSIDIGRIHPEDDPIEAIREIFDVLTIDSRSTALTRDIIQDIRQKLDEAEQGIRSTVRELSESHARFEQWDRRKDQALASLAHELRNPINVVTMLIELIERQRSDPERLQELTPRLRHQARRLARLVSDIHDAASIKSGALMFHEEPVNLNEVLHRSLETIEAQTNKKRQRVTIQLSSSPLVVRGDSERIEQILTNILSNATKYTQSGGTIVVESEASGREAVVRVRDNGCGIPREHLKTIFDEFTRIIPPSGDPGGMGIGLGLVKNLVRMHQGTVTARSDGPEKGSEFEVRLPLAPSLG